MHGLLQRDQRGQRIVGVDLLLDTGEFDELLGELVGVERAERVLILQLGRQQLQEALEVAGDLRVRQRVGGAAELAEEDDEVSSERRARGIHS